MEQPCSLIKGDLYLVFQPIINLKCRKFSENTEFEVLLRSKSAGGYPGELMDKYIEIEVLNKYLLTWYLSEMVFYCQKHPNYIFNVNIHPQQFLHTSTWEFLTALKEYAKQVNIEITEKPFSVEEIRQFPIDHISSFIKGVKSLGFKVSFDDVGSGQNSLEMVAKNIEQVDCLKFSLHTFRFMEQETVAMFLRAWHQLAHDNNIRIVVEGIEDETMSQFLFEKGIHLQQGYYWAKAVAL